MASSPQYIPEQELAIQIAEVNCVHVDHIDIFEARKSQILQDFTAKTTCTDNEHLGGGLPSDAILQNTCWSITTRKKA